MTEPTTISSPELSSIINQQFFIEPLGGPKHPISYLEAFPETLYNKTLDSNLVALMYAILGPAGIGTLKQNYLEARIAVEENGLRTTDLDELYADPFAFARLPFETYEDNTEGLLSNAQWEKIQESDASYKNRAINYLKAIRAGGTLLGMTLASASGLNHAVEVVENYRALYDRYSDDPLELPYLGVTNSTEEIIILPRQELPKSSEQTLTVLGNPIQGVFRLALPLGANGEVGKEFVQVAQNNTVTGLIPYNADFAEVRQALEELPIIGSKNVEVEGGPFPGHSLTIRFTGDLADMSLPQLLVTYNSLLDVEEHLAVIEVIVNQAGFSADGEIAAIPSENWYYAQTAIDNIKPMTAIVTPGKAPGLTKRQPINETFSDSIFIEVLRYVTGRREVAWPPRDATHWIVAGEEREAPVTLYGQQAHYLNFHNISTTIAYTEKALTDPNYETNIESTATYPDTHIGAFSLSQQLIFPFLQAFNTHPERVFAPAEAAVNPPELRTTQPGPVPLVDGFYPADYAELANIPAGEATASEATPFWASQERPEGSDFLEIDLGTVQAVNTLMFEAMDAPYNIALTYDVLDGYPARRFIPVTYINEAEAQSILHLGYKPEAPNTWSLVSLNFQNTLGQVIYTRFMRLEFTRRPGRFKETEGASGKFVFQETGGQLTPYSIEVRNLRIGRNLSP